MYTESRAKPPPLNTKGFVPALRVGLEGIPGDTWVDSKLMGTLGAIEPPCSIFLRKKTATGYSLSVHHLIVFDCTIRDGRIYLYVGCAHSLNCLRLYPITILRVVPVRNFPARGEPIKRACVDMWIYFTCLDSDQPLHPLRSRDM